VQRRKGWSEPHLHGPTARTTIKDHDESAHAAAILTETAELRQIADRTQGLPPRDLFILLMSSVEDLATKVRASNHGSEDHDG